MRQGKVTPEKNNGKRLTIPARVRTPLEAFRMFEQGQNIDLVAGYYESQGYSDPDFYMMDRISKLETLNHFRALHKEKQQELEKFRFEQEVQRKLELEKQEELAFQKRVDEEISRRISNVTKPSSNNEQNQQTNNSNS